MTTCSSGFASSRAKHFSVVFAMVASLAFLYCDSSHRYRRITANSNEKLNAPALAVDARSPSGYELGMRRVILPPLGVDGCHWIMHTQKMVAEASWRIRFTDNDNSPDGREIHWSHALIWWLILLGMVHSSITGLPLAASVESVSPYSSTLLLVVLILTMPWLVYRRFGTIAAVGMALGLGCSYFFSEYFVVGSVDHHGIAASSSLLSVLCLALGGAGWVANGRVANGGRRSTEVSVQYVVTAKTGRRFFVGSAIAGSVALWVSAATAVPTFLGIGIGVFISSVFFGRDREDGLVQYSPELWRLWGIAGCCGSIFFYLLEYFPSHMGMRLEVNHPLYAFAWLGAGELAYRFTRWRTCSSKRSSLTSPRRSDGWLRFIVAVVCVTALPTLVFFFPERFFWIFDRFLWTFHRDYIHEFKSFVFWLQHTPIFRVVMQSGLLPMIVIVNVRMLMLRDLGNSWRGILTLTMMPALLMSVLGLFQFRWIGIACGLWLATIPTILGCLYNSGHRHRFAKWESVVGICFALFIFFAQPASTVYGFLRGFYKPLTLGAEEAFGLFVRDLSHTLRRSNPDKDIVLISGPTTTTYMMYFGGMRGVGTLYWENLTGLKSTAKIYAARSDQDALELIKEHGVTHMAIFASDSFASEYTRLIRDLPFGAEAKDGFVARIASGDSSPMWLKPVPYRAPAELSSELRLLVEVKPDQTFTEARFAWSEFFETQGEQALAIDEMMGVVVRDPDNRDAWFRIGTMRLLYEKNMESAREALVKGSLGRKPTEVAFACNQLAINMYNASMHREAAFFFQMSLDALPDQPSTMNAFAWLMATSFDDTVFKPAEAFALAERNKSISNRAIYLDTLAAAQAACGKTEEAASIMREAIEALSSAKVDPGNPDPKVLAEHLKKYESGKTMRSEKK